MTDRPNDPAAETPMQRALRLKKARDAQPKAPRGGKVQPGPAAGIAAGASKPWIKK